MDLCTKCGGMPIVKDDKSNTHKGLYCSSCGKWIKWLSKSEVKEYEDILVIKKDSSDIKDKNELVTKEFLISQLNDFCEFLDKKVEHELTREPLSKEDALIKCSVAVAYERDKNTLLRILDGQNWNVG